MTIFWLWDHPVVYAIINGVGMVAAVAFFIYTRRID